MSTPPQLTVTGTLLDIFGNVDNGSGVIFQLCNYGPNVPYIPGSNLLCKTRPLIVSVDALGKFSQLIYGNDVISPPGTYYTLSVNDEESNRIQTQAYRLTGTGSVDIANLPPFNPVNPVPALQFFATDFIAISSSVTQQAPASLDAIATAMNYNVNRPIPPQPQGNSSLAPPGYSYTLTRTPTSGVPLNLYYNGILQIPSIHYTITGRTIGLMFYTNAGDNLYATYQAASVN
jgi:hypothetical protein